MYHEFSIEQRGKQEGTQMKQLFEERNSIDRIRYVSHRGFQPMAPANSLAGFQYAGYLKQWGIETDVRCTKDGLLVCCHDADIHSTYDGEGLVAEMTWRELSRFRLNRGNRLACLMDTEKRMPLFSEYLAVCKRFGSIPFIDVKADVVGQIIRDAYRAGIESKRIVLSSVKLESLEEAREIDPNVFIHWIFAKEAQLERLAALESAGISWDISDARTCPADLITSAHNLGLKVCLRAGDTPQDVQRMMDLNLDYIPTNTMHLPLRK